ncbi:hypothetical protein [Deinococcus pimensis]|nr:hypothetical protein [Deinococcus pimensis]
MARFNTDLSIDTTFGQGGVVVVKDNADVNVQPGGGIVVGLGSVTRLLP